MMRTSTVFFLGAWLVVGCSGGQNNNAPPLAKVSGTVTLDRRPMEGGEVRFLVPGQPPKSIEINKDGTFSGEAYTGKNRVEVVWDKGSRPDPMDPKGPPIKANVVADEFSGPSSLLTVDIDAGGKSDLKFEVKSGRK